MVELTSNSMLWDAPRFVVAPGRTKVGLLVLLGLAIRGKVSPCQSTEEFLDHLIVVVIDNPRIGN